MRRFFCSTWRKHAEGGVLTPLEATALKWIAVHPEYHLLLADEAGALAAEFTVERGQANPFLHLAMHLALEEQLSIDQPSGIARRFARLQAKSGERHAALHEALECLAEMVWRAQRDGAPPDGSAYLDCLERRARR